MLLDQRNSDNDEICIHLASLADFFNENATYMNFVYSIISIPQEGQTCRNGTSKEM